MPLQIIKHAVKQPLDRPCWLCWAKATDNGFANQRRKYVLENAAIGSESSQILNSIRKELEEEESQENLKDPVQSATAMSAKLALEAKSAEQSPSSNGFISRDLHFKGSMNNNAGGNMRIRKVRRSRRRRQSEAKATFFRVDLSDTVSKRAAAPKPLPADSLARIVTTNGGEKQDWVSESMARVLRNLWNEEKEHKEYKSTQRFFSKVMQEFRAAYGVSAPMNKFRLMLSKLDFMASKDHIIQSGQSPGREPKNEDTGAKGDNSATKRISRALTHDDTHKTSKLPGKGSDSKAKLSLNEPKLQKLIEGKKALNAGLEESSRESLKPDKKKKMRKRPKKPGQVPPKIETINANKLSLCPISAEKPTVPRLSYGLDRVLFNPGVYYLQDPRSRVYNFDPYLQSIMPVSEFDFDALSKFVTSSKDQALAELARAHEKRYTGSSSSMTLVLSHFHYLLSRWRPPNMGSLSTSFKPSLQSFTQLQRSPSAVFIKWQSGSYAIDADKEFDSSSILSLLGQSMEKLLTREKKDFERYRKSSADPISPEERETSGAFHYTTFSDFLLRSQLDAYNPNLPGTGMFDLKTRAVVSVRMNTSNLDKMTGYEISGRFGEWYSFEREYHDMIRAAFLKYSLQVRMGRMDGIFIAYHNTVRIFGFQYVSLDELDTILHGQSDRILGDLEFNVSLELMSKALGEATARFPEQTLRMHFETREGKEPFMYIFAEPLTNEEMHDIQTSNQAEIEKNEEKYMRSDSFWKKDGQAAGESLSGGPETNLSVENVEDNLAKAREATEEAERAGEVELAEARKADEDLEDESDYESVATDSEQENDGSHSDKEEETKMHEEPPAEAGHPIADLTSTRGIAPVPSVSNLQDSTTKISDDKLEQAQSLKLGWAGDDKEVNKGFDQTLKENYAFYSLEGQSSKAANAFPAFVSDSSRTKEEGATYLTEEKCDVLEVRTKKDETMEAMAETTSSEESPKSQESKQKGSSMESERPLLAMILTISNKVDGKPVQRPQNLKANEGSTSKEKWEVEYKFEEIQSPLRARELYRACQARRRKQLLPETDREAADAYMPKLLREMSERGLRRRQEEDEKDRARGNKIVVLGQNA